MSMIMGPVYDRTAYAGFFRRALAVLTDIWICICISMLISNCIIPSTEVVDDSEFDSMMRLCFLTTLVAYNLGFRFLPGGTPGYRLARIRYAYMLPGKPPLMMIAYRLLIAIVLIPFLSVHYIWILFDERKQAWHDKVSGFYVIKSNAQPIGTEQIVQRIINFMHFSFVVFEPKQETAPPQRSSSESATGGISRP
jgi:uncharacterized RDD family membrane protein YckC